jgi:dTDP-4-dehydrorhamnose 3,5-epimerase-like enzyme
MEMVKTEIVKRFADHRGVVFEPLEENSIAQQKNVHVVVSKPGAVRGNHYHIIGTETLVVCGPALVRIRQGSQQQDFSIPADKTFRMVIPPGVAHAIQNAGDADNLLVAFNTNFHDPANPDTVQDILIPTE